MSNAPHPTPPQGLHVLIPRIRDYASHMKREIEFAGRIMVIIS